MLSNSAFNLNCFDFPLTLTPRFPYQFSVWFQSVNLSRQVESTSNLEETNSGLPGDGNRLTSYLVASFANGFCRLVLLRHFTIGNGQTVKAARTTCQREKENSVQY